MAATLPSDFTLDEAESAPLGLPAGFTPDAPVQQMTGVAREAALPASNALKGLVSIAGLPGDIARGVGYIGGQQAEQAQNPDPITAAMSRTDVTPTSGPQIVTPQMLAASPGKPNIPAPSFHNPLDTESLLSLPRSAGLIDRPDLQPQDLRERLEAAGSQGVGAALPLLAGDPGGLLGVARTLTQGAGAGIGGQFGGTVGQAVAGVPGRMVGTLAGSLLGGNPRSIGLMAPRGLDAETAALAQNATDRGIPISMGQASESPFVKYLDSFVRRMPFSGYGPYDATTQTAFNQGLAGTFGETADKITPEVLNNAYTRIGNGYDSVASRTSIPASGPLLNDLQGVVDNARLNLSADSVEPVERQAMNIVSTAANNGGVITGRQFKDLTARGGPIDTLSNSNDSGLANAGQQLDSVLKSHLAANAAPEDVALLRQLDTQYKALKTVEPLTMRADATGGASPSTGDISPAALLARVNQQYPTAARASLGELPLKDLAQIGQRFLKEPPSSGSGERITIAKLGEMGGAALAPFAGEHLAGISPAYTVPPLVASLIGPRMVGSVLRTPVIRQPSSMLAASLMAAYPQLGRAASAGVPSVPATAASSVPQ